MIKHFKFAAILLLLTLGQRAMAYDVEVDGAKDALQAAVENMVLKGSELPVADMLDVVFNADGTATDVSAMHNTVQRIGSTVTKYSKKYGKYMATFDNDYVSVPPYFYKVDYSSNATFKSMSPPADSSCIHTSAAPDSLSRPQARAATTSTPSPSCPMWAAPTDGHALR